MTMDPGGSDPGGSPFYPGQPRIRNPKTTFTPVGGIPPKKHRTPSGHAAGRAKGVKNPTHTRLPASSRAPKGGGTGGHSAAITSQRHSGHVARGKIPRGAILGVSRDGTDTAAWDTSNMKLGNEDDFVAQAAVAQMTDQARFDTTSQQEPGMTGKNGHSLGHHPLADGYTHLPAASAHALLRRAALLGYDAGSNTATIRLGNTPDSPIAQIIVQQQLTPAQMAAATEVYLTHNGQTDLSDASISGLT